MTDPTALPNLGQNASAPAGGGASASLADQVVSILAEYDFNPRIDDDGDIMYTVEDQNLFVRVIEGEVSFIRIFGQWQITDDITKDLTKRLNAANDVTLSLNIIKVGIARDMVVVTGEHVVTSGQDLPMLIPSTTQMVLQATQLWHQSVNAEGPHASEGGIPVFAQGDTPTTGEGEQA